MTSASQNPMDFMTKMWSSMGFNLPGLVTPTFDLAELDKRINDMKTVESWLRMNLSILQMTIQNLEMQRATVSAVHAMSQMTGQSVPSGGDPAMTNPAIWPWNMMHTPEPPPSEPEGEGSTPPKAGDGE